MLHLGLTGLTVGTPFFSYRGPGKTKSFLKLIGGEWAILDDQITFDELLTKFFSLSRNELYNQYNTKIIQGMVVKSEKHFEFCKNMVEQYS